LALTPEFAANADVYSLVLIQSLHWLIGWAVVEHLAAQQQANLKKSRR